MKSSLLLNLYTVMAQTAVVNFLPDVSVGGSVQGQATITQNANGTSFIQIQLQGLAPNSVHGWHIHASQITGQNCTTGGGHFNPMNKSHGGPQDDERHYGDLGNIQADGNGIVNFQLEDRLVTLNGALSVIGKGFVIHELQDDLGQGNAATSKTVGNAGKRLACGNIVMQSGDQPGGYCRPGQLQTYGQGQAQTYGQGQAQTSQTYIRGQPQTYGQRLAQPCGQNYQDNLSAYINMMLQRIKTINNQYSQQGNAGQNYQNNLSAYLNMMLQRIKTTNNQYSQQGNAGLNYQNNLSAYLNMMLQRIKTTNNQYSQQGNAGQNYQNNLSAYLNTMLQRIKTTNNQYSQQGNTGYQSTNYNQQYNTNSNQNGYGRNSANSNQNGYGRNYNPRYRK